MTTSGAADRPGNDEDIDPRKVRSRARLLDAATGLLKAGGLEAVTIDAVTRASNVARTTLYRHFDNVVQLRAATLEYMLPPVVEAPTTGTLRDRLVELVGRQADVINDAPVHLTTLAWLATAERLDDTRTSRVGSLRHQLIERYRRPFDELFDSPDARALLTARDLESVLAQLIGPVVFVRLTGIGHATRADCARIVDDFLAACGRGGDSGGSAPNR
ncbi:TetR/AcrR family transcriptional regulator [Nocardia mexicana]|uniref:TetR family transcriptional regulator n=1 Tax=Nocardia mexicana TaxID=279262 RepID=A0A370HFU4_9NOCA|nr:TetR/AcrR family transcriptional regulator [Nocardia mexicana]RDI56053.1 TetR family transcriptional regulator [Nocardia mexicana]